MIFLMQSVQDFKDVATINDLTIQGILFAVILALGGAVVFLYKTNQKMQSEFVEELRKTNDSLIKVNNSYNEFVNNMMRLSNQNS